MNLFKKTKIQTLKDNLKVMQERNEDLYKRDIEHQKKAIAQFRLYKEEITKLSIENEDLKGFLEQEKEAKEALKKERTKLRREITMLKKEIGKNDGKKND